MEQTLENPKPPIFSFANGELNPFQNGVIRHLERVTGQPKIKRLYLDYLDDNRPDELFWSDALDRLSITINLKKHTSQTIPKSGPLLIISNHPFGVVDGIALCALVSQVRQDYKLITHRILRQAPAVMDKILPIDFDETEQALQTNLETRRLAVKELQNGGVVIIFPSGAISRAKRFVDKAVDPIWKKFVAKLATQSGTQVLPFFIEGQNTPIFQFAIQCSQTLGYSLMFREICKRMYRPVNILMRPIITEQMIADINDRNKLIEKLRNITYFGVDKPPINMNKLSK